MTTTPETPYTVRNATSEDVEQIIALEKTAFPVDANTNAWRLRRDIAFHAPSVKLAIYDDEPIGCVRGTMQPSRIAPDRPYGSIISLAVSEAHRQRGVGRLLLGEMISEMQQEDPTGIELFTRVSNLAMQGLAAQCNFVTEATIENYYVRSAMPEDAYHMILRYAPLPE